ncbi:MAG TPA: 50S ribosomal protein L10 [Bacteroidetes bacterium]|nr:50S ribosomal protein L10 [Bacteroidota bacterium]
MNKTEKTQIISILADKFANSSVFYLTDSSTLTVEQINKFRRICFEKGVEFKVVKNTMARLAMEANAEEKGFEPLYDALKGPTAIMFSDTGNLPAKIISEFRKDFERPILKAAYVESAVYFGDDKLEDLTKIKSKEELIGDIITLLQSPVKNVIGSLKSGGNTISGLLKALEERA